MTWTLPTWPSVNRTFIPCGWLLEFVKMSFTVPLVSFPLRWSAFSTMSTEVPGVISFRFLPFILLQSLLEVFAGYCSPFSIRKTVVIVENNRAMYARYPLLPNFLEGLDCRTFHNFSSNRVTWAMAWTIPSPIPAVPRDFTPHMGTCGVHDE